MTVDKSSVEQMQLIDIEKVIASKDKKLARRIPKFLIRYLKKIVHQDEINEFLIENQDKSPDEFIDRGLEFFEVNIKTRGLENLPDSSRVIVAANHPLGGIDGVGLTKVISENLDERTKITANDLLMNLTPVRPKFIGINKHGENAKSYVSDMHESFSSDYPVIFFPAGLISRRKKGVIEDLEWKRTFIKKAVDYERDILPVHISGRVSNFFYRLANLRKFLGIKQNIEMLYLPNELFKQRQQELVITIGKPISWKTFTSDKTIEEWAQTVKETVYRLNK